MMKNFFGRRLLIGILAMFSGVKFILAYILLETNNSHTSNLIILIVGINFLLVSPMLVLDEREENASNFAVIGHIVLYVAMLIWTNLETKGISSLLLIYSFFEIIVIICFSVFMKKKTKRVHRKVKTQEQNSHFKKPKK